MPWRVPGTSVPWANNSFGTQSCPTPPGRSAGRPDPTHPWYVQVIGFPLFVLAKGRSGQLSTIPWRAELTVGFWATRHVGVLFFPPRRAPPPRGAPRRPEPPVICSGFGFDKLLIRATINIFPIQNKKLWSPKPRHTTGGSGWGARRGGGAGSGRTRCQQNCSPRRQASLAPPKASQVHRLNIFAEARTSEILCKPMEEQSPRLTTGSSAVYPRFMSGTRSALFSWLLTGGPTLFCPCKPFSCKACPGI